MALFLTVTLIVAAVIFIILIRKKTSNLILKITLSIIFGVVLAMIGLLIGYFYIAPHTSGVR